ncbi:MAG: hypothetical protein ACLTYN_03740 [Dysosmobacter welbionis]
MITGHTFDEQGEPFGGWGTLANLEGTLVFLMGLANLEGLQTGCSRRESALRLRRR